MAKPSVMQWVLAVRETVVIMPSRINIVAQALYLLFHPPFPSLTLIHTPLFGWAELFWYKLYKFIFVTALARHIVQQIQQI